MELVNTAQKFSFSFSKLRYCPFREIVNIKHIKWNWISSMKFETVRIYLVEWRFWFVVWSKNFATVANTKQKKPNNNNLARAQHTFLYISLTLFCTTAMWNFMLEYVVCAHHMFCRVPGHFFLHCRSFSPCWSLFLIFSPQISMFSKFVSCFLSNALALLSTSLKTLKFSRTWLCPWFSLF